MPLDASIIMSGRGPQFVDPIDTMQKGITMKRMMQEGASAEKAAAEQQTMSEILKKNVVTGPDGKTSVNNKAALSDLYKVNPQKAKELQSQWESQDFETLKRTTEVSKQLAWSSNDPQSYMANRQKAIELGLPNAQQLPPEFSPQFVQKWQVGTLNGEEQLKQKQAELDNARKDKELGLKEQELGIKRTEAKAKANNGEGLPLDKKKFVETLSTKNANKAGIKNQIDSVMENWDNLSDVQKVAQGRQLLKTLNSPEGADAVGAEEAKRLGSMLEFATGNFTNSNPTQFGRDLVGFKEQAMNTSKGLGGALEMNQKQIDEAMGRTSQQKAPAPKVEADVAKYAKAHGISYEDAQRVKMQRTSKQAGL